MSWLVLGGLYPLSLLTVGAKRLITAPRLGNGDKGSDLRTTLVLVLTVVAAVLLFAALFIVESTGRLWWTSIALRRTIFTVLLAMIPGGSLAGLAYLLGYRRLYIHALLTAVAIAGASVLQSATPLLLAGVAIVFIGAVYLIRFLRSH